MKIQDIIDQIRELKDANTDADVAKVLFNAELDLMVLRDQTAGVL